MNDCNSSSIDVLITVNNSKKSRQIRIKNAMIKQ